MTQSSDTLDRGRDAFAGRRWSDAYTLLGRAAVQSPLDGDDLERLAIAAHLLGHEAEAMDTLERAHHALLAEGETVRAVRAAFWLTASLRERGEVARAGGWASRLHRVAGASPGGSLEDGYATLLEGMYAVGTGDAPQAHERFLAAITAGERHGDDELLALARHGLGRVLVHLGRPVEACAFFDDVMVAITTGELLPIVVGVIYCSVLDACREMFDLGRAQEWTAALSRWCDAQPDIVPYRGQCLAYRAEIMGLHGAWTDAFAEAERARAILSHPAPHPALGATLYQLAELHRLRGEFAPAEEAYREANRWGRPPEPGLALLRLAQGRAGVAEAAIRRVLDEAHDPVTRARLLPAFVEIMLAAGDIDAARTAAAELAAVAAERDAPLLHASAAQAEGALRAAEGDPRGALTPLRRAWSAWLALEVPYEAARVRVAIARACAALGDIDTAQMDLDAARWTFRELGASAELTAVEQMIAGQAATPDEASTGLTPREVEVLRLVASGLTNRDIASQLVISEKTAARHVSNILAKLELPSRTAAAAFAYEHGLA